MNFFFLQIDSLRFLLELLTILIRSKYVFGDLYEPERFILFK